MEGWLERIRWDYRKSQQEAVEYFNAPGPRRQRDVEDSGVGAEFYLRSRPRRERSGL